jgi:tetratricopeptide (TPR) repeat protein
MDAYTPSCRNDAALSERLSPYGSVLLLKTDELELPTDDHRRPRLSGPPIGRARLPGISAPAAEVASVSPSFWQPGSALEGRYEVIELVGEGGMGVVWRVFDREWDRDLALKLPRPVVLESPVLRDRYVREAETWIGLGVHPHIVQCWFVTEVQGVPALFLDYLTGGSLANWMDDGHLRPGQWDLIVELAMQAAEGLAYAHSKGVVHRDVKPENLLVRGDERVCVTDFGLVKTGVAQAEEEDRLPLPGGDRPAANSTYLGTPSYAAPEQWGTAEQVGPSADMYALGVTLYEMCAGRRPFDHEDEDATPGDIIRRHLFEPVPDPREFQPGIPTELAHLCMAMLDKEPNRRPPQMIALREALHDIHRKLTPRKFRAAAPLPGAQSPDVLNNQAVSLHSLGKSGQAIETLRRGLGLDPGHPECLYNLVQIERRAGHIDALEALRRLEQARAYYPLALLLLEQGLPERALACLHEVRPELLSSPGLYHRARGDALMYLERFAEAEEAYLQAREHMPKDAAAEQRQMLAAAATGTDAEGAVHFPSSRPVHQQDQQNYAVQISLDQTGDALILVSQAQAVFQPWRDPQSAVRVERPRDGGRVLTHRVAGERMVIADTRGYEFRSLPSLRLMACREGRLLACSSDLTYVLTEDEGSLHLYDMEKFRVRRLPNQVPGASAGTLLAAFDRAGENLRLLLSRGQLASLDEELGVVAEPWPGRVEGYQQARCLAVGPEGETVVGLADGTVRCYHPGQETVLFDLQLEGTPRAVEIAAAGTRVLVRTIRGHFFLLDRRGQVLLRGDGPLTISPDGERALILSAGQQILFRLDPLHELRRWPHAQTETAKSVAFSGDGRMAVVLDVSGSFALWQTDESSRVYQRELLMSPGRGYADILSAHEQFQRHLEAAQEALQRDKPQESHRHLQRARKVPGYGQGGPALDFAWRLLRTLPRDSLESVWEQWSLAGCEADDIDLHPDGRQLLYSVEGQATMVVYQDGVARPVWSISRDEPIRFLRYVQRRDRSIVVMAGQSGQVTLHDSDSGQQLDEFSLEGGAVTRMLLHPSAITYLCQDGSLGQYSLVGGMHRLRGFAPGTIELFAPYQGDRVMATTDQRFGLLDLSQTRSDIEPLPGLQISKTPCFVDYLAERELLVLAFDSGKLRLLELGGAGVLATLAHGEGTVVTAFLLLPELSVAITTTACGRIVFWDLFTEQPLEQFLAHRDGVNQLRGSQGGRFLLTCGSDGMVRYWETCWTTREARPGDRVLPWLGKSEPQGAKGGKGRNGTGGARERVTRFRKRRQR